MRSLRLLLAGVIALSISLIPTQYSSADLINSGETTFDQRGLAVQSCPPAYDIHTLLPTQLVLATGFNFGPTGQDFKWIDQSSLEFANQPQHIVGCYLDEQGIADGQVDPLRAVGSISRRGILNYYFTNGIGETWNLILSPDHKSFTTEKGSKFYSLGNKVTLKNSEFYDPYRASRITIKCKRGTLIKSITAANPKCPRGWKLVTATPTPSPQPTPRKSAAASPSSRVSVGHTPFPNPSAS